MRQKFAAHRIWAIGYVLIVFGLIVSFYTDAQQDNRQDTADAKATKVAAVCVKKVVTAATESTAAVREASETRDDALVAAKRALRELIRLRVIEQVSDSDAVRQAAEQYMTQTDRFVEASRLLDEARADNPIPDPETICQ